MRRARRRRARGAPGVGERGGRAGAGLGRRRAIAQPQAAGDEQRDGEARDQQAAPRAQHLVALQAREHRLHRREAVLGP
jgi:hypothetical protein